MNEITWHETKMTSNNAPSPLVASASSEHSTPYGAWRALNGTNTDSSDAWMTPSAVGNTTGWIRIDFGVPKKVNRLKLTARIGSDSSMIRDFDVFGSTDFATWDTLQNVRGEKNWTSGEVREYKLNNKRNTAYRYYRIQFFNNSGRTDLTSIAGILFGYERIDDKSLIFHGGKYKKWVDDSHYLINETKINPINNTYQRHYSMTQTSGNTLVSNKTDIFGTVNGDIEWQGEHGLKFNGTNNFVEFSGKILSIGAKSIFFQIKTTDSSPTIKTILSENSSANEHGMIIQINGAGGINVTSRKGIAGTTRFNMNSVKKINDGQWHNVLITWDGTINTNGAKLYIDDLIVPDSTTTANATETVQGTYNTIIGKSATSNTLFINANIRNLEIYHSALVFNSLAYDSLYEYIESKYLEDISDTLPTSQQFIDQGMDNLSPLLDRTITILEPTEMTQRNDILSSGEIGKVFIKTIDLKKYFDLRSIRTEVK